MRKPGFDDLEQSNPGGLGEQLRNAFHQSRRECAREVGLATCLIREVFEDPERRCSQAKSEPRGRCWLVLDQFQASFQKCLKVCLPTLFRL
jgi:hypothetical protein